MGTEQGRKKCRPGSGWDSSLWRREKEANCYNNYHDYWENREETDYTQREKGREKGRAITCL